VDLVLLNLYGLPTSWTPEVTSVSTLSLPLCISSTVVRIPVMLFVRKKFSWQWNISNEIWSRGVRLVVVVWNDYSQKCVALTPSHTDLCIAAGLRWLPFTELSPTNTKVRDFKTFIDVLCHYGTRRSNSYMRKLTLWPCTEPGESSLNLHTLFMMRFSIIVTLHVCIPSSLQPWDSVIILNTYLIPPACYLSHSSRSPWFTSLACSQ